MHNLTNTAVITYSGEQNHVTLPQLFKDDENMIASGSNSSATEHRTRLQAWCKFQNWHEYLLVNHQFTNADVNPSVSVSVNRLPDSRKLK